MAIAANKRRTCGPRMQPTRLNKPHLAALRAPLTTALIAFRLGTATSEHYHEIAGAVTIAVDVINAVPRHAHVMAELQPGIATLNAIFERDGWQATPEEVTSLEELVEIYLALMLATPGKTVLKCIRRAMSHV